MKHLDVDRQALEQAQLDLCQAFLRMDSVGEIQRLLWDLCTPAELEAMVDRWRVVPLLKAGKPYREIHDLTGVSVTTIGRVARFLESGNGGYATAYQRVYGDQE